MSSNIACYSFRLRPGKKAEDRLLLEWGCARWVWNQCVEAGERAYKMFLEGVKHDNPTFCKMSKSLTRWRADHPWLKEGSQVVQQQTVRKWSEGHQQAFRQCKRGFPRFKSGRRNTVSLEYTTNGFRIKEGRLFLAGGISTPVVWSRALPDDPKSCVISRDISGGWHVAFVVCREVEIPPPSERSIGIDWGVRTVATTTEPEFDLQCGDQIKKYDERLKTANRAFSRSKIGSSGRRKAQKAIARLHLKIARQRKDRAHKWSRKIVSAFGYIAIEDFKPKFLAKTRLVNKAADGAVGMTKHILLKKAESAGRTVALVPPAYTTMTCSKCGSRNKARIPLSIRYFSCDKCGFTAGRDENSARVIRDRAGFNPTNVDDVGPRRDFGCVVAV